MQDRGEAPSLPENPASYITDWLFQIGPSVAAGMGEGVIGYPDLAAFERIEGIEFLPWEAKLIRRLSGEWIAEKHRARKDDCSPPYEEDGSEAAQDSVGKHFGAMFKALQRKKYG